MLVTTGGYWASSLLQARILEEFCRIFFRMVLLKDSREERLSSQLPDVAESKD